MRRSLIAIGCDAYEYLKPLHGAEHDARQTFDTLLPPSVGDYDPATSCILLSPTLAEAREAIAATLFHEEKLDTLTIFFAGHGGVGPGSFYMALRDAHPDRLSASALSLGDVFRMIAEAAPVQTYIIIDACESGGLISDLAVILKSDVLGRLGTPGITLLATAAADQVAGENEGGGFGTNALLACVRGELFIQDSTAALDLVEIGRIVSQEVRGNGGQTPVVWGLNLYGPPSFCKNPHARTGDAPLRSVLTGWPDPDTMERIRVSLPGLWESYATVMKRWDPREFVTRIEPILDQLIATPTLQTTFVDRVAASITAQAVGSSDRFREIEVRATCLAALLRYSNSVEVASYLRESAFNLSVAIRSVIAEVVAAIDQDKFALLADGGMAELYQLPIRLSKLLGWSGFAALADLEAGALPREARGQLTALLERLLEHYSLSLVSMSDSQAPFTLVAAAAAAAVGAEDLGEVLMGHLFSSAVDCGGRVADVDLPPDKVLEYLLARCHGRLPTCLDLVAQPTELLTVLLKSCHLFDLSEVFSSSLSELDHLHINAFITGEFADFAAEKIDKGMNATFHIGHEIWTVDDLEAKWPHSATPASPGVKLTAIIASLLFPDRSPWFLLSKSQAFHHREVAAQ